MRAVHSSAAALATRVAFEVELVGQRLEPVVGLRNGRAAERVGLEDVGAGREILPMDAANHIRARQCEHVAVALEIVPMIAEPVAAKVGLVSLRRWIIVPMAPSRSRMRLASRDWRRSMRVICLLHLGSRVRFAAPGLRM